MKYKSSVIHAVITIFEADMELRAKALPHVNINAQTINWHQILKNHFGSGHLAAILWAKSIWTSQQPKDLDIFERSSSMDIHLRKVVLHALAIRWGLIS